MLKARVCFSQRLSSIGEYSFQVLFLMRLPHQQLLAFSSKRQTGEEEGRQHQKMDRPWVCKVPEGSGEQGNIKETGCEIICGALTTLMVKGLIMMMLMMTVA